MDAQKIRIEVDIYSLGATFYSLMSGLLPDRESEVFRPLSVLGLLYSSALINIVEKNDGQWLSEVAAAEFWAANKVRNPDCKLLNESRFQGIFRENPKEKGEILHSMGNSYFALEYYQEAVEKTGEPLVLPRFDYCRSMFG